MLKLHVCVVAALLSAGCSNLPTPADYYVPQADAFAKSAKGLSEGTKAALVEYRTRQRADYLRAAIVNRIVAPAPTDFNLSQRTLLCGPRNAHFRLVQQQGTLQSVGTALTQMSGPSATEFKDLLKSLATDYSATFPDLDPKVPQDKDCVADLTNYVFTVYPTATAIQTESLSAIKGAFDVIWGILEPLVVQGLQITDRFRRGAAIQRFFSDFNNRGQLETLIKEQGKLLTTAVQQRRHDKVARFVRESSDFVDPTSSTRVAAQKVVNFDTDCVAVPKMSKTENEKITSPEFAKCFSKVYAVFNKNFAAAVQSAADYDAVADLQASTAAADLLNVANRLGEMAKGEPTPELLKVLYKSALTMADFGKKVDTAFNDEDNRKKAKDAYERIKKELGL